MVTYSRQKPGVARRQPAKQGATKGEPRQPKEWRPAVILEGGPSHGYSYFEHEMLAYQTNPACAWVHDYVETDEVRFHPENGNANSKIWRYKPKARR